MKRRDFLQTLGLGTAYFTLSPHSDFKKNSSVRKNRPNLVYIFADQLRTQSLGYTGDPKAVTPHIDQLAKQGVNFSNAVSNFPVCAAHRASLFTGKYPSTTGMVINELRMNPHHRCFGHVLTDNEYETGYIGKWHLWANQAGHHREAKNSYIPPEKHEYRLGFNGFWAAYNFNHHYYEGFYFTDKPQRIQIRGYEPEAQTDMAVRFINRHTHKPFALFLSYGPPHPPFTKDNVPESYYNLFKNVKFPLPETWSDVPDKYMDRNTNTKEWLNYWKPNLPEFQRIYYALTSNLDWNIGRILKALDKAGLSENTIVVFSSDHGEMFGAHGRIQKLIFYEEAARVPFLIRWPGKIPAGLKSNACLGTPDIMPTLLGLMGLPIPEDVEGMDLSPLAKGQKGVEPDAALLQGMGHTYLWKDGHEWRAVRNKRYTYAVYRRDGSELLFDNKKDPLQTTNLIDYPQYKSIQKNLRRNKEKKMSDLNDNFEKCSWYRDHWTDGNRNILQGAKG